MPGGRPSKYKPEFADLVVKLGSEGKTLAEMAAGIGVDRSTLDDWVKQNPEFSRAVKAGLDAAQAWWEEKGRDATFGAYPGFNATSYIFQMKNRFKEDWRDKVEQETTGSTEVVHTIRHEVIDPSAG